MPVDLTVYLDDRPGQVATVGRLLGEADVNLLGGFALVVGGQGIMHILLEDEDAATNAYKVLEGADLEARETVEVLLLDIEDRPGALGELAQPLADAGVNITTFYLATDTRVVIGAEDLDAAKAALSTP